RSIPTRRSSDLLYPKMSNINRVVNNNFLPQMGAVLNKFLVDRMDLVGVLTLNIVEKHEFGDAETIIDNIAFFCTGRNANAKALDGFYFRQGFQAFDQLVAIFF